MRFGIIDDDVEHPLSMQLSRPIRTRLSLTRIPTSRNFQFESNSKMHHNVKQKSSLDCQPTQACKEFDELSNDIQQLRISAESYINSCLTFWEANRSRELELKKKDTDLSSANVTLSNAPIEIVPAVQSIQITPEEKEFPTKTQQPELVLKQNDSKLKPPVALESKDSNVSAINTSAVSRAASEVPEAESESFPYLNKIRKIKEVKKDTKITNELLKLKMKINRTVGQLTADRDSLILLIKQFHEIFEHPQRELLYYITCKKIVKQCEREVAVRKESVFPLALLCVYVSNKFEGFSGYLIGRILQKNEFLIPRLSTGNPRKNHKKDETDIQFMERMVGISTLYFAIMQVDLIKNNLGIAPGFLWLQRMCLLQPIQISPLLLHNFFEIAGHKLIEVYGNQALNTIQSIVDKVIPNCSADAVASTTRLSLLLEETVLKTGTFPKYNGSNLK